MSVHYYVRGFAPPTEEFKKMKKVYDACDEADIDPPNEVDNFFDGENPNGMSGIEVDIDEHVKKDDVNEALISYEVEIEKLPKSVKFIRFYVSY